MPNDFSGDINGYGEIEMKISEQSPYQNGAHTQVTNEDGSKVILSEAAIMQQWSENLQRLQREIQERDKIIREYESKSNHTAYETAKYQRAISNEAALEFQRLSNLSKEQIVYEAVRMAEMKKAEYIKAKERYNKLSAMKKMLTHLRDGKLPSLEEIVQNDEMKYSVAALESLYQEETKGKSM